MFLGKSQIYLRDIDSACDYIPSIGLLNGASILVTGATGTIGSAVVDVLARRNQRNSGQTRIYAAGRNLDAIRDRFAGWSDSGLSATYFNASEPFQLDAQVDYVLHAAGNAHPATFASDPVGTLETAFTGTRELLNWSIAHGVKRLLFVSSGEVYGVFETPKSSFSESEFGHVDPMSPRSCYPMGKRFAEALCATYSAQYGVQTVVARPCHTFGPTMTAFDSRAHAQFIRAGLSGNNIVMNSPGLQMRSYAYVVDCVSALLAILLVGVSGEAYNVANSQSRCTIREFAEVVSDVVGVRVVRTNASGPDVVMQSPIPMQVLDSSKLESLGWCGEFDLIRGIEHTLAVLRDVGGNGVCP